MLKKVSAAIKEVSSVSEYEFIKIVATIEAHYQKEISCYRCLDRFKKYKEGEVKDKRILEFKKAKGCFGSKSLRVIIGVDEYQRRAVFKACPGNYTSLSVNYFIDLFYQYEKGVLPFKGGLMDQPSKIIEVFQLIDDKISQKKNELIKRESRKNSRGK